jgi:hypothetical protein
MCLCGKNICHSTRNLVEPDEKSIGFKFQTLFTITLNYIKNHEQIS